jgi:hypothetical protein
MDLSVEGVERGRSTGDGAKLKLKYQFLRTRKMNHKK